MQLMKIKSTMCLTLASSAIFLCSFSFADNRLSIESIKNIVKQFVTNSVVVNPGETIEVNVSQAGAQFQVPVCSKEVQADFPKTSSRDQISTVELTCNGTQTWHLYVPVDVQIYTKVLAAKRTLPAKDIIRDDDLDYIMANKNRMYHGYYTNKEDIVGQVTLHTITAGTVITRKNLHAPILIHKNQSVNLTAQSRSVIVSMAGIAKSDGALNSLIKVYNPSSKRTIDAVVVGPNKAQVAG